MSDIAMVRSFFFYLIIIYFTYEDYGVNELMRLPNLCVRLGPRDCIFKLE